MIGPITPPHFHRRADEHRLPVHRFAELALDFTRPETLRLDGSNRISLASDRSGKSEVNCLCLNGLAGNYASTPDQTVTTADIDIKARAMHATIATSQTYGAQDNGSTARDYVFGYDNATGKLYIIWWDSGGTIRTVLSTVVSGIATLTKYWVRVTLDADNGSGGHDVKFYVAPDTGSNTEPNWTSYQLGATTNAGAFTTSIRHQAVIITAGLNSAPATSTTVLNGNLYYLGISATIDGSPSVKFDPSGASKLATSVVSSTGETWTINSTGALGARISGERDVYQATVANQAVWSTGNPGELPRATYDGSNDYHKAPAFPLAQPDLVLLVGSQEGWTLNDFIFDGNSSANLAQYLGGSPQVRINAGSDLVLTTWSIGERAVISSLFSDTSSSIRKNRAGATTGSAGAINPNGFTLGSRQDGANAASVRANEVHIYQGSQWDAIARDRLARWACRRHRIAA